MDKRIIEDATNKTDSHSEMPTFWRCNIYCRKIRHVSCEGKEFVREDAPDECPYLDEMLY